MKEKKYVLYLKILANYLLAGVIILFLIFVFPRLIVFFWPFIVGWIIALIANPLVHLLEHRVKIVRKHGSAIVIVLTLAIVISLLYFIFYVLIKQGISFAHNFPEMYATVSDTVQGFLNTFREKYSILPAHSRDVIDMVVNGIGDFINRFIRGVSDANLTISNAGMIVKSMAEGLLMTIITILLSYFLTAEHDNIVKAVSRKMPNSIKQGYDLIIGNMMSALGGYFKAQFKIMCFVFIILLVGLLILGVDYAVLFALIIAVVDFLPVLGAGAIIWPWCVYELLTGHYIMAIVLFALYLVCQAVRQFLQPKMVADSIGLSPLATIFYMFIGYRFLGVIGMIVGIPVGMILVSFFRAGVFDRLIYGARIIIVDFNEWRKFDTKGKKGLDK